MRAGDLVRFKKLPVIVSEGGTFGFEEADQWVVGLLLEYHTWEKVGTVLYKGKVFRIRAEMLQKAGKKDESR